jgi:hypothetical protein
MYTKFMTGELPGMATTACAQNTSDRISRLLEKIKRRIAYFD